MALKVIKPKNESKERPFYKRKTLDPLYKKWCKLLSQCYTHADIDYKKFGKLGYTVCGKWKGSYDDFANWAYSNGWAKGMRIVQKNKTLLEFSEENTIIRKSSEVPKPRATNKFVVHEGTPYNFKEFCIKYSLNYQTAYARFSRGWATEDMITKSIGNTGKHSENYSKKEATDEEI